jgi:RNA polymerase sigma factor (sigma-70 family)
MPSFDSNYSQSWLQRVRNGEEAPWRDAYRKVYPSVRKHVCAHQGNEDDAADVLQDALIITCEKIRDGRLTQLSSQPETYIFGVSKNLWFEKLKDKKKSGFTVSLNGQESVAEESDTEEIERHDILQKALGRLDEQCLKLLRMTVYEKTEMAQVALAFQLANAKSASTKKYRCMENLTDIAKKLMRTML